MINKLIWIVSRKLAFLNLARRNVDLRLNAPGEPGRDSTIRNALLAAYDTFVDPIFFTTHSSDVYLRLLFFLSSLD